MNVPPKLMPRLLLCLVLASGAVQAGSAPLFKSDYRLHNPAGVVVDFETGRFDADRLSTRRLSESYSGRVVSAPVRAGRYAARFELRPGDHVSDGRRAEVRDRNNAIMGDDVWYAISTLIPVDFTAEPGNSYVLIQWHDQQVPDTRWHDRSPPLAVRFLDGRLDVTLRHAFAGMQFADNGREAILYSVPGFAKGVWHDFVYHVLWSAVPDGPRLGFVQAWLDGRQIIDYRGPVGYFDRVGPYVKFGLYARHDVRTPHVVYHDEYRRGQHYWDVCLRCDPAPGCEGAVAESAR